MLNTLINKLKYSFRTRKPVTLNALECQELLGVIERNKKAMKFLLDHALDFNGEMATDLQVEECEELYSILKGE